MSPTGTWLMALAIAAMAHCADADDGIEPDSSAELNDIYLRAGGYLLDSLTIARVDSIGGNVGSSLSFEDDLNVEKRKATLLAGARLRLHDRHYLEFEYFSLQRFGEKRIQSEIEFGDTTFPVGADLASSFTTEVTRLGYAYRILKRPDWGLAASVGVHVTRLHARVDAVTFDNGGLPNAYQEIASVTAPLPVFGLNGARRLSEKWTLVARGQWFFLEVDDVGGSITHAAAYFEHNTFRNVGFGIGYDWFDINIDTTDSTWHGKADIRFKGPLLFVQATF